MVRAPRLMALDGETLNLFEEERPSMASWRLPGGRPVSRHCQSPREQIPEPSSARCVSRQSGRLGLQSVAPAEQFSQIGRYGDNSAGPVHRTELGNIAGLSLSQNISSHDRLRGIIRLRCKGDDRRIASLSHVERAVKRARIPLGFTEIGSEAIDDLWLDQGALHKSRVGCL
jgi:hypothetical protein